MDEKRQPWYVHAKEPLVVAGIWQDWGHEKMSTMRHSNMPCNQKNECDSCPDACNIKTGELGALDGRDRPKAAPLMTAVCDDFLQYYSVNTAVNSNKATGAGLILPMKAHLYS